MIGVKRIILKRALARRIKKMEEKAMIKCNACKNAFKASKIIQKTHYLNDKSKTQIKYFSCPGCGKRYFIGIYDKRIRSLIKRGKKNKAKREQEILVKDHIDMINKILEEKEK